MDRINEKVIQMGYEQARACARNPPVYFECLVKFGGHRGSLKTVYNALVAEGLILPIEKAPESLKREIWQMAKEDAAGRLELEKLKILAKCLYAMSYLLMGWEKAGAAKM